MEMKKCKECGKLFVPKSARTQYCDDLHYRPCPVCGKLVEAKYLSDPARCCSKECQKALRAKNTPSAVPVVVLGESIDVSLDDEETFVNVISTVDKHTLAEDLSEEGKQLLERGQVRTYVGRNACGFIQGHAYAVDITKEPEYHVYSIAACYDLTSDEGVNVTFASASMNSFNQFFAPISKSIVVR